MYSSSFLNEIILTSVEVRFEIRISFLLPLFLEYMQTRARANDTEDAVGGAYRFSAGNPVRNKRNKLRFVQKSSYRQSYCQATRNRYMT